MFGEPGELSPSIRDNSGAYLIDRSYTYFEPILNYLRTGNITLDHDVNMEGKIQAVFGTLQGKLA